MPTLEEAITELAASHARVDERTIAILKNQEDGRNQMIAHEDRDKEDFKEVNTRLGKVESNQRWMLKIGSTVGAAALAAIGALFKGIGI